MSVAPVLEQPRQAFVQQVMGLPVSIHVRGPGARGERVAAAVECAYASLRRVDATFSTWRPDSEVSRIRRGELGLDDASATVRTVADLCAEASTRTGGAFTAWLPDPDGRPVFDPTGLVKGWAVEAAFDRLVADLAALGDHDVLVSAGGDVTVACARTDTADWVVGVEDPRDRSKLVLRLPLRRGAVATSGVAARGAHIVDPSTGVAVSSGLLSATVVGPGLMWADVCATAAFVSGDGAAGWLGTFAGHAAVLLGGDGVVRTVRQPGGTGTP